jgi:hypothetical protein
MRKQTVKAVFAIAHVIMNAGIESSINMRFLAADNLTFSVLLGALIDCKILLRTQVFDKF